MDVRIIEAQPDEYNVIQYIAGKTWPVAYGDILSPAQLDYMIEWLYSLEKLNADVANGHRYYLAKDDKDTPLGFIGIEHGYGGMAVSKLHKIYILPELQGKGVGQLLLAEAERLASAAGSNALSLNVNRHNKARHFYEKHGFFVVKSEDIDIGNGYRMEDYVMEKPLASTTSTP